MKASLLIALAALVVAGFAFPLLRGGGAIASSSVESSGKPAGSRFYCDRSAIPLTQIARKVILSRRLRASIRHTRELPDGFEFELGSGPASIQDVAEWVSTERLCCPFFNIGLQLTHDRGPMFLRLTGDSGVKQFIQSEFGPEWFANTVAEERGRL